MTKWDYLNNATILLAIAAISIGVAALTGSGWDLVSLLLLEPMR